MEEEEVAEVVAEEVPEDEEAAEEEPAEEDAEEEGLPDAVKAWLTQIAGDFEDGEIYVSFMKQSGELTYGSVSTYSNIAMTKENLAKIAELEEKMSEPIAEPKLTDSIVSKGDVLELTVYETVMKRKGLA